MSKPEHREKPKTDKDVLDEIGDLIGKSLKKGRAHLDRLIDEAKKDKPKDQKEDEFLGYLRAFIDDRNIAAITPSSKFIVNRVIKGMNLSHAKVVVEYGAAQGVVTRRILEKIPADAKLVAVEFNKRLYDELLENVRDPRVIPVHGDVRRIDEILAGLGIEFGRVDAVTSGVPFSYFSNRARHELLLKTSDMLRPGGRFVPYQVTTHLIPLLKDYFEDVDIQFEVRNIPPHFVFTAIKKS
jgi:phospholipid N-methyltransferase